MIRVQFGGCNDAGSEVIELFGAGPFSHVDAVMPDGALLGARSDHPVNGQTGVQIRPAGYQHFDRKLLVEIPCTPAQEALFYSFLTSQIGKPYDKLAIAAFAVGRDWREANAWFCSELIAAALEYAGIFPLPLFTSVNKIDPDRLVLVLSVIVRITWPVPSP